MKNLAFEKKLLFDFMSNKDVKYTDDDLIYASQTHDICLIE